MSEDDTKGRPLIQSSQLNPNDVILGRGFKAREYPGTKQFHEMVRLNVAAYFSSNEWQNKNIVGYRIVNSVNGKDPPGRFLQPLKADEAKKRGFNETVYYEVDCNTALRKTKQTLRDFVRHQTKGQQEDPSPVDNVSSSVVDEPFRGAPPGQNNPPMFAPVFQTSTLSPPLVYPPLAPSLGFMHELGLLADRLPWLGGRNDLVVSSNAVPSTGYHDGVVGNAGYSANESGADKRSLEKTHVLQHSSLEGIARMVGPATPSSVLSQSPVGKTPDEVESSSPSRGEAIPKPEGDDTEVAQELLNLLTAEGAQRVTAEDIRQEMDQLTEEEKQAALEDMFGSLCQVDQVSKRVKRPDNSPVETLLETMRREINLAPADEKPALLEAIKKAPGVEFCNDRLELFLIRENMDATKAARRFVKYWEERRKVFGKDKFCLPLTLDGAFQDDAVALEAGVFTLLPGLDASGRQIVWIRTANNTKKGYDSMSFTRAVWYVYEAAAQHPNASKGIVNLVSAKGASLWDADPESEKRVVYLGNVAWPCLIRSFHLCHLPHLVARYVMPLWMAFADRENRSRTIIHDTSDDRLAEDLARYGLTEDTIPTDIPGGKLEWNHVSWLAKRRLIGL